MIGRLADLFRLAWGLLYWNTRKSWFQLRRGRSPCPCQSPSDSGRAYETACDASLSWHDAARFRRVCPLLVSTPQGFRCSVNAQDVRPFWGRAFRFYGGTLAAVYLCGALAIFVFLRTVGYPISIVHLVWPGSWHRVTEVRGWFFMERANRAFHAGRHAEGMLYLTNAYEFDPGNYTIGFTLAQRLQLGQPSRADEIYRRLLVSHPAESRATKQAWFRSLLARGDFAVIEPLAASEVLNDPEHAGVWMRALVFATRHTGNLDPLHHLVDSPSPAAQPWRSLLQVELMLRGGDRQRARVALNQPWHDVPAFSLFYQIRELTALGEGFAATDLLGQYSDRLDSTARTTLLLETYAALGATQSRQRLVASLLAPPLNPATLRLLSAHLIRRPDPALLNDVFARLDRDRLPLSDTTLESYLAVCCAAGVAGDWPKMAAVAKFVRAHGEGSAFTLSLVEAFFRGDTRQTRIAALLPALPMGLEVHYALLERYPGTTAPASAVSPKS